MRLMTNSKQIPLIENKNSLSNINLVRAAKGAKLAVTDSFDLLSRSYQYHLNFE